MRRSLSVVAAAGVALGALVPATADAAAPAWKVARSDAKARFTAVAAINARNVWAVGRIGTTAHAWRFDGKRWADTTLPAPLRKRSYLFTVAGSAANDVWAFGSTPSGKYALHWNGAKWTISHTWKSTGEVGGAVVGGPKDVWVHGVETDGYSFGTWHFDGRSWTRPRTGFTMTGGTAVSARNAWAVGTVTPKGALPVPVVRHWNGRSWTAVKLPALSGATGRPGAGLTTVAARSSADVWVAGTRYERKGAVYAARPLALHWDGKSWRRSDPPAKTGVISVTPDGKGGAWAATAFEMFHFTKGRWAKAALPTVKGRDLRIYQLSNARGTASVWGAASYVWDGPGTTGAIIRY
ncbi:hypothetical protein [Actinomadura logoneensis]|uniref:hypothetical protein n=1 Tax=Actinomadura logoneensis TaxID=2293572 RepID=UPI0013145D2E|nr:hypothetical protein [Actinomadura logoneensis]